MSLLDVVFFINGINFLLAIYIIYLLHKIFKAIDAEEEIELGLKVHDNEIRDLAKKIDQLETITDNILKLIRNPHEKKQEPEEKIDVKWMKKYE